MGASKLNRFLSNSLIAAAKNEGIPLHDLNCIRDFSGCPEGWVDTGNGSHCDVPLGYTGSCGALSFEGKTAVQKSRNADRCEARFPCLNASNVNWSEACPEGWRSEGKRCVASNTYQGPCIRQYEIGNDRVQKKKFARECAVNWPSSNKGQSFLERGFGSRLKDMILSSGPIRSPPKAAINVISNENISTMQQYGSAVSIEAQIKNLKASFEQALKDLEG